MEIEEKEYEKLVAERTQYLETYVTQFTSSLFSDGIISEIDMNKLQKYLASPDMFKKEINNLVEYFYVSNGETRQLFEMVEALPTLNYTIETFQKDDKTDEYTGSINKTLHRIKHKRLTRDLLKQNAATGNVVGMWIGNKNNVYPYIFDNIDEVYPVSRYENGDWICELDLAMFDNLTPYGLKNQLDNLYPHIKMSDIASYRKNISDPYKRYIRLPQDRTFVLRTGALKRNQGLGTSWATSGLYDILHKKKLKDVEQSVANKILNAIAVLKLGNEDTKNSEIPKAIKAKVVGGVKTALEAKKTKGNIPFVALPEYTELTFPELKVSGLDGKQFTTVNKDIQTAFGVSESLTSGSGGNFASAKTNLETLYKRIAVMLEDIESAYEKMFNVILPAKQRDNFTMTYDKEEPLKLLEKITVLMKMNDKGWSTKHVIDNIPGINFDSYLQQTMHETEELDLQGTIKPYQTSYTMNGVAGEEESGRPEDASPENENTIKSKTSDGNSIDY